MKDAESRGIIWRLAVEDRDAKSAIAESQIHASMRNRHFEVGSAEVKNGGGIAEVDKNKLKVRADVVGSWAKNQKSGRIALMW